MAVPSPLRRALLPISSLYASLVKRTLARRSRHAARFPLPVISVGSISVGGSGKTPLVLHVLEHLQQQRPVIVLTRGYGRKEREPIVWRAGELEPHPDSVGDEPALIARSLRRGAIGVGADRTAVLRGLAPEYPDAVVVLDDGFQHVQIRRDVDIAIVDAAAAEFPWPIPAGRLRENASALGRAGIVLCESDHAASFAGNWSAAPVFRFERRNGRLRRWGGEGRIGERFVLVTGIARPERVVASLGELGIEPWRHLRFGDHHRYVRSDVERILSAAGGSDADVEVVTTTKDAVKLQYFPQLRDRLVVLETEIVIHEQDRFLRLVEEGISTKT